MDNTEKKNMRPEPAVLRELYAKHTVREIAAMYGVTERAVYLWIKKAHLEHKNGQHKQSRRPDPETLCRLYAEHDVQELADMYEVSYKTARRWLMDCQDNGLLTMRLTRPGRRRKEPSTEALMGMLHDYTTAEIAVKCGVKKKTVQAWLSRLRKSGAIPMEGRPVKR